MNNAIKLTLSWALVGAPLAWAIYVTLLNALRLF
jgi:hypothetical protein